MTPHGFRRPAGINVPGRVGSAHRRSQRSVGGAHPTWVDFHAPVALWLESRFAKWPEQKGRAAQGIARSGGLRLLRWPGPSNAMENPARNRAIAHIAQFSYITIYAVLRKSLMHLLRNVLKFPS